MRLALMQPDNGLSGRTQSETENSRLERPIPARKTVLPDPTSAKYPPQRGKSGGWVQNGLTGQTGWWCLQSAATGIQAIFPV
jgi:hypothetical protein